METSSQSEQSKLQKTNQPQRNRFKVPLTVLVVISLSLFACYQTVIYGAPWRTCEYTVKDLSVPREFLDKEFFFVGGAYLGSGPGREYSCLNVSKFNIYGEGQGGWTFDQMKDYYSYDSKKIYTRADKNKKFKVIRTLEVTKHGIGTIDSGPGPVIFSILTDDAGNTYADMTGSLDNPVYSHKNTPRR